MKEQQAKATGALIRAQEEKAEERNIIMAEREVMLVHCSERRDGTGGIGGRYAREIPQGVRVRDKVMRFPFGSGRYCRMNPYRPRPSSQSRVRWVVT